MGYTTVNEAAVPVLSAQHTHEELRDTPIVDKALLRADGQQRDLLDLLEAGELERAKHVVAWQIWAAKAYGVKAVNPGGVTAWKWGKDAKAMFEPVPGYNKVTPATIIASLAQIVDRTRLAAPAAPALQQPGRAGQRHHHARDDEGAGGQPRPHGPPAIPRLRRRRLGHDALRGGHARRVLQHPPEPHHRRRRGPVRQHRDDHRRRPLAALCSTSSPAASGATSTSRTRPAAASSRTPTREATWSTPCSGPSDWNCLLLINDPWRIFLTTDHPNGACFWRYPEIIHLLMNADLRQERVKTLPAKALGRIVLPDLNREYTLYEIAIITSAGPARALGLSQKGHLGVGADADVAIYNEKPDGELHVPLSALRHQGRRDRRRGRRDPQDRRRPGIRRPARLRSKRSRRILRPLFQQYYTMSFENYPVELERIEHPEIRPCK